MTHLSPVLTERLVMSLSHEADAFPLAVYHARNDSHLAPWEPPRQPGHTSQDYWARRLALFEKEQEAGSAFHFVLRARELSEAPIVGTVSLTQIARGPFQACYLGFGLDRDSVGRGLMYEALEAVLRVAFDELSLHRVMANYVPENLRSARLLRRLGFVVEGYARDYLFIDDSWRDHVLTSLTNPSPSPPRAIT